MARHATSAPCSPYLKKPLRSLHAACLETAREHGLAASPCGICGLAEMCGPAPLPVARRRRLSRPAHAPRRPALGR